MPMLFELSTETHQRATSKIKLLVRALAQLTKDLGAFLIALDRLWAIPAASLLHGFDVGAAEDHVVAGARVPGAVGSDAELLQVEPLCGLCHDALVLAQGAAGKESASRPGSEKRICNFNDAGPTADSKDHAIVLLAGLGKKPSVGRRKMHNPILETWSRPRSRPDDVDGMQVQSLGGRQ